MGELVDVDADAAKLGDRGRVGQRDPCLGLLNLRGRRCGGDWGGLLARHGLRHRRGHKAAHGRSCGHGGGLDGLALLYRHAHGDHHCLRRLLAHGRTSHGFGLECSRENGGASVSTLPAKAELKTASAFTIPLLAMRAAGSRFPNAAFIASAAVSLCSLRSRVTLVSCLRSRFAILVTRRNLRFVRWLGVSRRNPRNDGQRRIIFVKRGGRRFQTARSPRGRGLRVGG